MQKQLLLGILVQICLTNFAHAWMEKSVTIQGQVDRIDEQNIFLIDSDQSIYRLPKHSSDEIFGGKPVLLNRKISELKDVQIVKMSTLRKPIEVSLIHVSYEKTLSAIRNLETEIQKSPTR